MSLDNGYETASIDINVIYSSEFDGPAAHIFYKDNTGQFGSFSSSIYVAKDFLEKTLKLVNKHIQQYEEKKNANDS